MTIYYDIGLQILCTSCR